MTDPVSLSPAPIPTQPPQTERLRALAQEFEAAFLAQMLKDAGFGKAPDGFGGGMGEDQMQSFLIEEQARVMARAGGIGLGETVFRYLTAQAGGDPAAAPEA
ncbi:rod-binding protein [Rhabdonatronobacter sediminivivens]|uniref:rod-binding protein n=1 Tax=Rhabdonatronobacter sediminivivens TaxID=2743469 RepID=UPI002E193818